VCGKILREMLGVFCGNFSSCRPPWPACRSAWCGRCYTPHELDRFFQYTPTDEDGFDWGPKESHLRYKEARAGDNLLTPFQCDLCQFRNLTHRNPASESPQDTFLLCCIRRANLDEPLTVQATLRGARQMVALWRVVHLPIELPPRGPFPISDSFGLWTAIAMLVKSLEPGRYSKTHQQFKTIHKLWAAFSNMYMSSSLGEASLKTFGGETSRMSLTNLPTNSLWFERFASGCLRRMGQDVRQDWAIPVEVIHAVLSALEKEWEVASDWIQRHLVASVGAYVVIAFCGSFRGNEVFLADLFGLGKYLGELESVDHVIVPLLGRYKGEMHKRYHLTPLAATTNSGIQVRAWLR
jgi:hypothetical protein